MYNIINKKILAFGLATFMLAGVGCNKIKDFGTINVNPSGVTDPNLAALLTNVETGIAGYATTTRTGLYTQYWAET